MPMVTKIALRLHKPVVQAKELKADYCMIIIARSDCSIVWIEHMQTIRMGIKRSWHSIKCGYALVVIVYIYSWC